MAWTRAWLLGASLAATACSDYAVEPSSNPPISFSSATTRAVPTTFDDVMDQAVTAMPGFAGIYADENGQLVVRVKGDADVGVARNVARDLLARLGSNPLVMQRADLIEGARTEPADYTFRELKRVHEVVARVIGGMTGVVMTDIDEVRNRVFVGAEDDLTAQNVRDIASSMLDDPRTLIVGIVEPFETYQQSLRGVVNPIVGGVEITSAQCTLGYNVARRDGAGNLDPNRYFVTAAHCAPPFGAVTGMTAPQPKTGASIGFEVVDPPLFTSATDPNCPSGRDCRYSDAVLFQYTVGNYAHANVAWPILPYPWGVAYSSSRVVSQTFDPIAGFTVVKVGRTTGRTSGNVTGTSTNLNQTSTNRTILCSGTASLHSDFGDSGSPVFEVHTAPNGATVLWEVGVLWGGNGSTMAFSKASLWRSEIQPAGSGQLFTTITF